MRDEMNITCKRWLLRVDDRAVTTVTTSPQNPQSRCEIQSSVKHKEYINQQSNPTNQKLEDWPGGAVPVMLGYITMVVGVVSQLIEDRRWPPGKRPLRSLAELWCTEGGGTSPQRSDVVWIGDWWFHFPWRIHVSYIILTFAVYKLMVNVTIFLAYDWILWDMEEFLTVETWNIMDMVDMYGFIVLFSSVNACFFFCVSQH